MSDKVCKLSRRYCRQVETIWAVYGLDSLRSHLFSGVAARERDTDAKFCHEMRWPRASVANDNMNEQSPVCFLRQRSATPNRETTKGNPLVGFSWKCKLLFAA